MLFGNKISLWKRRKREIFKHCKILSKCYRKERKEEKTEERQRQRQRQRKGEILKKGERGRDLRRVG